jgi:hypothetical protein
MNLFFESFEYFSLLPFISPLLLSYITIASALGRNGVDTLHAFSRVNEKSASSISRSTGN